MSEMAKKYRAERKEKAHRLASGDPHAKVDASDWTPDELEEGNVQTGERPVSKRQFKRGGKVEGEYKKAHLGRSPRKFGGKALTADSYVNRDVREANEERDGPKHVGGFKKGGHVDEKEDRELVHKMVKPKALTGKARGGMSVSDGALEGTRPEKGGRFARKSGGRAKGRTDINIVIAPGGKSGPDPSAMPPQMPPRPVIAAPPAPPPPQMGAGQPPGMPGMPAAPPQMRKRGGRTYEAGAGSGEGRLEKIDEYGRG